MWQTLRWSVRGFAGTVRWGYLVRSLIQASSLVRCKPHEISAAIFITNKTLRGLPGLRPISARSSPTSHPQLASFDDASHGGMGAIRTPCSTSGGRVIGSAMLTHELGGAPTLAVGLGNHSSALMMPVVFPPRELDLEPLNFLPGQWRPPWHHITLWS